MQLPGHDMSEHIACSRSVRGSFRKDTSDASKAEEQARMALRYSTHRQAKRSPCYGSTSTISRLSSRSSRASRSSLQPSEPEADTEANILATVLTFDTVFAADPLKDKWLAWGQRIKRDTDNATKATQVYGYGRELISLCVQEHNLTPNSYDRAAMIKKGETVLSLCQVNDSGLKVQELVQLYWLVRLDRSNPGEEGEPRTSRSTSCLTITSPATTRSERMRILGRCISKASKPDELDAWDFKAGYEAWTRDMMKRLRDTSAPLSVRQVERLYDARKKHLSEAAKRERFAGLTTDEIASVEAAEKECQPTVQAD